ncbi:hypothetical protein RRG08_018306 [Elysia crispata]|uniref:Uncharacterized protein n=1 Tax=Elysia crispata TaxID=231223 RepID=A0AAE0YLB5_9GAST|nr:hypothetical protein RRG08_018306 [Elysia crispata]
MLGYRLRSDHVLRMHFTQRQIDDEKKHTKSLSRKHTEESMNIPSIAALLSLFDMAAQGTTCVNQMTPQEFYLFFCDSNEVFKGQIYIATSSVFIDPQGREGYGTWFHYHVHTIYKGPSPQSSKLSVFLKGWLDQNDCVEYDPAADEKDTSALVFAIDGRLKSCRHIVPWSCVPEYLTGSLNRLKYPHRSGTAQDSSFSPRQAKSHGVELTRPYNLERATRATDQHHNLSLWKPFYDTDSALS